MKKILIPLVMLLFGLGGGVGAAIFLAPAEPEETAEDGGENPTETMDEAAADDHADASGGDQTEPVMDVVDPDKGAVEFLDLSNQFIIPLVKDGQVEGIVVVSISLEVKEGTIAGVNLFEPKIRDKFLQVLFNHANNGGFSGNFTEFRYLQSLKDDLLRNAKLVTQGDVTDVLILDLVRQDS